MKGELTVQRECKSGIDIFSENVGLVYISTIMIPDSLRSPVHCRAYMCSRLTTNHLVTPRMFALFHFLGCADWGNHYTHFLCISSGNDRVRYFHIHCLNATGNILSISESLPCSTLEKNM